MTRFCIAHVTAGFKSYLADSDQGIFQLTMAGRPPPAHPCGFGRGKGAVMMPAPPKASVRPPMAFGKAVGARPAAAAPVHLGGRPVAPVPSPSMALVPASVGAPPAPAHAAAPGAASNLNFAHLTHAGVVPSNSVDNLCL